MRVCLCECVRKYVRCVCFSCFKVCSAQCEHVCVHVYAHERMCMLNCWNICVSRYEFSLGYMCMFEHDLIYVQNCCVVCFPVLSVVCMNFLFCMNFGMPQ